MSGRAVPLSPPPIPTCSSKSQYSSIPANSTTRRSWTSPQRPRTTGDLSACARLAVSLCKIRCACASAPTCSVSCPYASRRVPSISCNWRSTRFSDSRTGATIPAIALCAPASSASVCRWTAPSRSVASLRKSSLVARRVSDAKDLKVAVSRSRSSSSIARCCSKPRCISAIRACAAAPALSACRSASSNSAACSLSGPSWTRNSWAPASAAAARPSRPIIVSCKAARVRAAAINHPSAPPNATPRMAVINSSIHTCLPLSAAITGIQSSVSDDTTTIRVSQVLHREGRPLTAAATANAPNGRSRPPRRKSHRARGGSARRAS